MAVYTFVTILFAFFSAVWAASLQPVTNWGANPTSISMNIYVPDKLPANPAILLLIHPCSGSARLVFGMANWSELADQKGFIIIVPETTHDFKCWDVASTKSLTHEGGGDSTGLAAMVKYTLNKYKGDASRVYVTGTSSGGMMTNVLAATYPDIFAAGAAFSGVAAGCLKGSKGSSPISADPTCANGKNVKTGAEWAALVKSMYPSYTGKYPRMQLWHGTTDGLVKYPNLGEAIKEWSTIHGIQFKANVSNIPQSAYTKMTYGDGTKLEAYSAAGVGHVVPYRGNVDTVMKWFGL